MMVAEVGDEASGALIVDRQPVSSASDVVPVGAGVVVGRQEESRDGVDEEEAPNEQEEEELLSQNEADHESSTSNNTPRNRFHHHHHPQQQQQQQQQQRPPGGEHFLPILSAVLVVGVEETNSNAVAEANRQLNSDNVELVDVLRVDGVNTEEEEERKQQKKHERKLRFLAFFVVLLLLVCGGAVAAGLLAVSPSKEQDEQSSFSSPSSAPTTTPVLKNAYQVVDSILGPGALSGQGDYGVVAYNWLVNEDKSGILQDRTTPEWRIFQRYAAALLYFATGGPQWAHGSLNFLSIAHECEWKETLPYTFGQGGAINLRTPGIVLCDTTGHIEVIRIRQSAMRSKIPTAIMYLPRLATLDLADNYLSGSLPTEIGLATNLQVLDLSANWLQGTLPAEWRLLSDLRTLMLYENELTGTLPKSYVQWTNLKLFWVHENLLTGTLPEEYGNWTNLQSVNFTANCLDDFIDAVPSSYAEKWALINFAAEEELIFGNQKMAEQCLDYSAGTNNRSTAV